MLVSDLDESSLVPRRYLVQRLPYRFAPEAIVRAGDSVASASRPERGSSARVRDNWRRHLDFVLDGLRARPA